MFESISRRGFLGLAPVMPFAFRTQSAGPSIAPSPGASFPTHDPDLAREIVGVSHSNLARVNNPMFGRIGHPPSPGCRDAQRNWPWFQQAGIGDP